MFFPHTKKIKLKLKHLYLYIFYLYRFSWRHIHNSWCIDSGLTFEVDTLYNKEQFKEDHRRLDTFINSSNKEEINENHKHM